MKQFYAVLIILSLGIGLIVVLNLTEPEGEIVTPERPLARVEVIAVEKAPVQLTVSSQGTALPETEIEIPIEVSGRITHVSDSFRAGNRVSEGDLLFQIDKADYEATHAIRNAEVASAELAHAQEIALAEQAAADWLAFGNALEDASPLTLRKPQLAQAEASLESALAMLQQAKRDLERTEVRAPFDGFILTKNVDLGQYVVGTPTTNAGQIFSSRRAEVRLPLSDREMDLVGDLSQGDGKVRLYVEGGHEWAGTLVRFEATVDPMTRLNYAVAQVEAPFEGEHPLRRGLFVRAEILGRTIESAIQLPRYALRGSDTVYVMTADERLETRTVSLLQADDKNVVIDGGLEAGEKVVTSPIAFFVEGMPVIEIENK